MDKNKKMILHFSVDSVQEIEQGELTEYEKAKQNRFQKIKIRAFGDEDNVHTENVSFENLQKSADSIYDIPLMCEFNPFRGNEDFGGHAVLTGEKFNFGFVKDEKNNPIVFEKDEKTGKHFVTIIGTIWKNYSKNVLKILNSKSSGTEVSVELTCIDGHDGDTGKPVMNLWVYDSICFLGDITTSACQGAKAQLVFSGKLNNQYLKDKALYFSDGNIKIDNSKESATSGKWTNPRLKLLEPIKNALNRVELLSEAYLISENTTQDTTLADNSYPHHIIRNGELILHKDGLEAAFARASQQNIVEGNVKSHLLKHYKEMGMTTENFAEFGITEQQFGQYFAVKIGKEGSNLEEKEKEANVAEGEKSKEEMANPAEKEEKMGCQEKMEDGEENKVPDNDDHNDDDGHCEGGEDGEDGKQMSSDNGVPPEKTSEELMAENKRLQDENEAYMAKISDMADYEELKQYKASCEQKMAQEQEMAEMTQVMSKLEEKGISMSDDSKTELMNKRPDFANVDAWSNYVKAYAFDNYEASTDGIVKMGLIDSQKNSENNTRLGSWGALKQQFGE